MAEQTEKAFLKQPKVFLSSKKSAKGKRPGKGGNLYWKNIGLGFKTPREAIEGTYIDKKCPFTGTVFHQGPHLSRYEKRHSNIPAHISPCFRVKEGDHVIIGQCRPLSKTVRFNVLKVIPCWIFWWRKESFHWNILSIRVSNRGRIFGYFGFTVIAGAIAVVADAITAVAGNSDSDETTISRTKSRSRAVF
ncbi:40S ribosomal protein S11 [Hibiscus syriacus]|uniref:40S ribosomal protein S11 n=1 Tax=Hibiscus syriacus TaxID=106335 RepID=A0A6A2WQP9_HIBSY|nr:40S ribosomal protein S11 [Hibiscus syriacus]